MNSTFISQEFNNSFLPTMQTEFENTINTLLSKCTLSIDLATGGIMMTDPHGNTISLSFVTIQEDVMNTIKYSPDIQRDNALKFAHDIEELSKEIKQFYMHRILTRND